MSNDNKYLVGIDEGTTGTKTVVFDLKGNLISSAYEEYPSFYSKPGYVEQDIQMIKNAVFSTCKKAIEKASINPNDIQGVSMSTQGAACILLDKNGQVVREKMIGWQDLRNGEIVEEIQNSITDNEHYAIEGACIGAFNTGVLIWVKKNEPEIWKQVDRICTNQDFFLRQLGADNYYVDVASAHRISMVDVDKNQWSERLIKAYGLEDKKLPIVVNEAGKVIGEVTCEVSELTSLPIGCKICLGAQDVNCSSFGVGATTGDISAMVCGTFGASYIAIEKPVRDNNKTIIIKGNQGMKWQLEAFSHTSASAFRWFRDNLCSVEVAASKLIGVDPYSLMTEIALNSKPGSNGVTALTCLQGSHGRNVNDATRGTFLGISLATTKADIAHAVLEGICYEMKDILLMQEDFAGQIQVIRLSGGVTKSPMWCQMFADIMEKPIELTECLEAGALGAAMYAGIGLKLFKDCTEAAEKCVKIKTTYYPNPDAVQDYREGFSKYLNAFDALNQTFYK